jgi:tRNA pseudouridine38-40 synthase
VNAVAPRDLAVLRAEPAPDGFDARRDARSRTYCYRVLASPVRDPFEEGRALWWPHELHVGRLERCAEALVGTHDFTAFTPTETDHVRFERNILSAEWRIIPAAYSSPARSHSHHQRPCSLAPDSPAAGSVAGRQLFELWIEADAFMRHMVRVLVGTMLEVGSGRRGHDEFVALLDGAPRGDAGETAPPHGLYLASISY